MKNTLYYGDNLDILTRYIKDGSIDLIYLDPPFNSKRAYNTIYKSGAETKAFDDTWYWDEKASRTYDEIMSNCDNSIRKTITAMRDINGDTPMSAYLVMMTIRLIELHRVLKSTGSIYLHCDPTASHYLKIVMDTIFGLKNFRNEVVWHYRGRGMQKSRFQTKHDIILFYAKSSQVLFFGKNVLVPLDPKHIGRYDQEDERGKYANIKMRAGGHCKVYLKEGIIPDDVWSIPFVRGHEAIGYPTQKPLALLERIIKASSNPGDIVLDPFCGCGTAIEAAHQLNRKWIGIDITHLAVHVQKERMLKRLGLHEGKDYNVIGEPVDLASAQELADKDKYEFQRWCCNKVGAIYQQKDGKIKKGADKGIDGIINFFDVIGKPGTAIVSVKGGHTSSADIRNLKGTMEREKAQMGVLISLHNPTKDMKVEALSAEYYEHGDKKYQRIQILTAEDIINGKLPDMPDKIGLFKVANRHKDAGDQFVEM